MAEGPSARSAPKRLLKELDAWELERKQGESGIERLGPPDDGDLLTWEAVINGKGVGGGYDGKWNGPDRVGVFAPSSFSSTPFIASLALTLTHSIGFHVVGTPCHLVTLSRSPIQHLVHPSANQPIN